jgi:hypothetical protein
MLIIIGRGRLAFEYYLSNQANVEIIILLEKIQKRGLEPLLFDCRQHSI